MIGDIAFAGVAGDFFTEIGMHIKEQSVFDRTLIVTRMPKVEGVDNLAGTSPLIRLISCLLKKQYTIR